MTRDRINDPDRDHKCPACSHYREHPGAECDQCGHDPTIALLVEDDRDCDPLPRSVLLLDVAISAAGAIGCLLGVIALVITLSWIAGVIS